LDVRLFPIAQDIKKDEKEKGYRKRESGLMRKIGLMTE
jgi:hypothetical protein